MRIEAVTIFPEFFDVLDISLLGKAQENKVIDFKAVNLRDYTQDKHKTVDDSPYGGGAGMLMKPEPWGLALDELLNPDGSTVLIVPSPAGELFKQSTAAELAAKEHLVFACGRYEGIDQRVFDWAKDEAEVRLLSLGDYVLNGGEVASLAMIEAIARLIPGVIGNAESLIEESHSEGLLEYPSYTKPAVWRDLEVPEVLRSGNHAEIAKWRHEQSIARTKAVRPDLLD
ncbi:MAG: tRNA (guanosine(37)-N1)-methyltransferase TrmD [Micrococcales bacterium]|nr:tRNA (guanosine(37)-N1)-methyltransferase TrmD [Micrococcales bacterium]NBR55327.1 tRNA (guanosine(37)-N1)-methyltransferase TrmD [Micrococcales bacterium]NBR62183.1 tRNA (guanosine(37)-N1)-methyltransferase TrmD [Actinomycetota bacterium]NBT48823.1 tRNA (guanosine(37)-N1)-methyltransferase TrmD [Actinomycetota bacterium]NBY44204.1 tRNA (guanosine(37)-N1)-methyltransferase TrmD [Micrococcales bacterium]